MGGIVVGHGAGGAGEGFVWFWGGVGHCIEQEIITVARCGRSGERADHTPLGGEFCDKGSIAEFGGHGKSPIHRVLSALSDPGASHVRGGEQEAKLVDGECQGQ